MAELLDRERPVVGWVNLGEVFYVIRRWEGDEAASATIRDLREVITAELPDDDRVLDASRIKADHPLSYADAVAAATAIAHAAALWTGDPELLVDTSPWEWHDLHN